MIVEEGIIYVDYKSDSDIDIMILVDLADMEIEEYRHQLSDFTYDINENYDVDIKPIAKSDLHSANVLIEAEEYRGVNNRAYYAIYHAISAIYALDGKAYKRHKDALANFNKDYIRTEIFP